VAATSVTFTGAQIQAITPAHAAATVDVTVTNPGGQTATLPSSFTFSTAAFAILPEVGSTAGGTGVTLTGSNFNFQSGATVLFGGVAAASVTVTPPTQITAVTPAQPTPVLADVTVKNPDGTQSTLTQGFDYEPAPTTTYVKFEL
jgi:hypothetical protein